jgi:small subunit ribosomal protein S1
LRSLDENGTATVTVVEPENEDGYVELSLIKAMRQQSWKIVEELKAKNDVVPVTVKAANSGGLIADIHGIKAFLPVSQLSVDKYPHVEDGDKNKILEELKKLVGEELKVKILDFNQRDEKLILSEREVNDESVRKALEKYKEGDDVDVVISGIADFGVFVRLKDNPDVEGLVHISEIDHKLIESPGDAVKVGEEAKARIIEIKNGRISLSLKALKPNPWDKAGELFAEGQEIKGTVAKFNPFGALVSLGHDLQGLIHISEFESVEKMREAIEEGKEYTFVISQLKPDEKRIILKLK